MLWIYDILVWIRIRNQICRSVPLLFLSVTFTKNNYFPTKFCLLLFNGTFTSLLLFLLDERRIRTNNDGSRYRSGRFKNMQILQIQIQFNSTLCNITRKDLKGFSLVESVSRVLLGWLTHHVKRFVDHKVLISNGSLITIIICNQCCGSLTFWYGSRSGSRSADL